VKATILFRVASLLLIVPVAANTAWLVFFWHAGGPTNSGQFPFGHRPLTYAQVIFALEVFCSLCVLFGAFLSWHLVLLCYKRRCRQQGHLGRDRARWVAICRCRVAMD
jgi:hypothetical protein